MRYAIALSASLLVLVSACAAENDLASTQLAAGNSVKSQLRGYDLGPPFPAGFRDSGLINGYDEGEWIPFVAAIEGRKLEKADENEGGAGDGAFRASIILPTYSDRQGANGISDLRVSGTYGEGDITPIPSPFDDGWLVDNGYSPFDLGAYSTAGSIDDAPVIADTRQRTGPTRFGGNVSSVSVTVLFAADPAAERVELRFAIRLAPPDLEPIGPGGQAFPGTADGSALGAAAFHPGPGPLFAGYEVGDPTGIATVPIKVEHNDCEDDDDCVPGEYCGGGGDCEEPCANDVDCPTEEICEDGVCEPPPPVCTEDADCNGDYCVGGYCVPECPDDCADPEFCDPDPCLPPDGGDPPCVTDEQCPGGDVCEDGLCTPPDPPCDLSCPEDDVCVDDYCVPPDHPCSDDPDCPGGDVCVGGVCEPGDPPCEGPECDPCTTDDDCPGGSACLGGVCIPLDPPTPCTADTDCSNDYTCEGGYCEPPPEPCGPTGECRPGELCEEGPDVCVPEHPPVPCTESTDCPSGEACVGGFCEPPPTPCKNHHDCGPGEECVDKVCVPPDGGPCTTDGDCGGDYCIDGVCVPPHDPIPCTDAAECPAGDECIGGYCEPPEICEADDQCPGGEFCEDGTCRPGTPPVPCTVDEDCPPTEDDVYVPVCYGGFCTPGGGDCGEDGDCAGGEGCVDGVCIPLGDPTSCTTQYDCGGGAACVGGFCEPTDPADECETGDDCPSNPEDDVGPACVGGVCTTSRIAPPACSSSAECSPGTTCAGGLCEIIGGACELDADCGAGGCIDGWCGVPCTEAAQCAAEDVCALGRCASACSTYVDCGLQEACVAGGCVALPAIVAAGYAGDQSAWEVDVPAAVEPDVSGGCAVAPATDGGGSGAVWLLALVVPLALLRRRRRLAPLLVVAVFAVGCGDGGGADDDDDSSGADAGAAVADAAPGADAGPSPDADYSDSPFLLVTCADDTGGGVDAGGVDAGGGADAGAEEVPGVDESCCDPTGMCGVGLACIEGPEADQHRCRPLCDLAVGECPAGGVCADFGGTGVCIPASTEGLECAPELCDSSTICVGSSADDAVCRRRCNTSEDCDDGESCTQLTETDVKACL